MPDTRDSDSDGPSLLEAVVAGCHNAIDAALAAPHEALGIAAGLSSALDSLKLVAAETAKGPAGMTVITSNVDAIVREALARVLVHVPDPELAKKSLADTGSALSTAPEMVCADPPEPVVPQVPVAPQAPIPSTASSTLLFSEVSQAYIDMRREAGGEHHKELKYLRLHQQTFLDIVGDKPVTDYKPSDLQQYVTVMQYWPANVTKRAEMVGSSTLDIIEQNRDRHLKPIAEKTLRERYVSSIKAMFLYGMADAGYRYPFAYMRLRYPKTLAPSAVREEMPLDVLDRAFEAGIETGYLDYALLPLLAFLTSRRIGLLVFLKGSDFRMKDGVWIAHVDALTFDDGVWKTVPTKTPESTAYFVLHSFLVEIGFAEWASRQEGYIFKRLHETKDPAMAASKNLNRHFRRCGARGQNVEVLHSLRHDGIEHNREAGIATRTTRKQAGHTVAADPHEGYGRRSLKKSEREAIVSVPLIEGIDWSRFYGLDFDALARKPRHRGGGEAKPRKIKADSTKKPKSTRATGVRARRSKKAT